MLIDARSGREFLKQELARRIGNNARYSLRAFARHLGLSPGELSEILKGKRRLSVRSVTRISRALGLSTPESRHLLMIAQLEGAGESETSATIPLHLDHDAFRLVADWYCFAILSLADCVGFRGESAWVASRLGISRPEAEVALERLERLGLLVRKGSHLAATDACVSSPHGVPSEAVRSYHRQMLELAKQALDSQPLEEREFGGAGFAVNPGDLPALKSEIAAFWKDIVARYSRGRRRTEVYQLEMAFFRLSKPQMAKPKGESK